MKIDKLAFDNTTVYTNREQFLLNCLSLADIDGHILEFGVFKGGSINFIAKHANQGVYGFDSFEGLPEDWQRSENDVYAKGHFDLQDGLPPVHDNVTLIKGFFDETLNGWYEQHKQPIRLLHIDADLYTSAKYVLETLNDSIVPGTVIIFDELCDWTNESIYPMWEHGEWKALNEWCKEDNRHFKVLARTDRFSAAIMVLK